jgi:DNA-binding IclR family transcriptional regulator
VRVVNATAWFVLVGTRNSGVRCRLLAALDGEARSVDGAAAAIGLPAETVERHLAVLRANGVVVHRDDGRYAPSDEARRHREEIPSLSGSN